MEAKSAKQFNTTGPCVPFKHYMLPVLPRLSAVEDMIKGEFYFVVHAPRQSGKTTFLDVLTDKINSEGKMYALNVSLMTLQTVTDVTKGMNVVNDMLNQALFSSEVEILKQKADTYNLLPGMSSFGRMVRMFLIYLCEDLDKELVIFFDEADCLPEAPLIPFLAQIRDGYNNRYKKGNKFPRSMALVGMRDIRDYLTQVRPDEQSKGVASPFNIKKEAFTLPNFTEREIGTLYRQHTEATGQVFEDSAVAKAWYWSEGQPWLVNALADVVITNQLRNDYKALITGQHIDQAAHILILRNDTHFDSIKQRLLEPRVRRVIEAVLIGANGFPDGISDDDVKYVIDLGLLKDDPTNSNDFKIANPLYQEIIPRFLNSKIQYKITKTLPNNNILK
ncbi:MAG: AAA-like domain-containing protein [Deltaproteobacteria bacterium]|jgi:hypothetical protein|nr:AAA-like domain-containing protein [Deltaproteobacteria bacterium]